MANWQLQEDCEAKAPETVGQADAPEEDIDAELEALAQVKQFVC